MKSLMILAILATSTTAMAESKCYNQAKAAALAFVKKDTQGEVSTIKEFDDIYGSDVVDLETHDGWQKEYWSFYGTSAILNVEVDAVKKKCFIKNVDLNQNDQDEE